MATIRPAVSLAGAARPAVAAAAAAVRKPPPVAAAAARTQSFPQPQALRRPVAAAAAATPISSAARTSSTLRQSTASSNDVDAAAAAPTPAAVFPAAPTFSNEAADPGTADIDDPARSFHGIAHEPFPPKVAQILAEDINPADIEIKPDGLLYLPEIKYRRILNRAFGPGAWGLVPRGPHSINAKNISREYALFCLGRFVSQARGEQDFFGEASIPTASEGCKSNALMRCCKDLGIAWELWDPVFIRQFKAKHAVMVLGVHTSSGAKKWLWRRTDRQLEYPYREEPSSRS